MPVSEPTPVPPPDTDEYEDEVIDISDDDEDEDELAEEEPAAPATPSSNSPQPGPSGIRPPKRTGFSKNNKYFHGLWNFPIKQFDLLCLFKGLVVNLIGNFFVYLSNHAVTKKISEISRQ